MSANVNPQRPKRACISCRQRKRRCDGEHPCTYCFRNRHECEYETSRKRAKHHHQPQSQPQQQPHTQTQPLVHQPTPHSDHGTIAGDKEDSWQLRLLEANWPAHFVRQLGLRINPGLAPRLNYYAWNLGLERETTAFPQQLVHLPDVLNVAQMREMAACYFKHVAPVYDFLDQEYIDEAITLRWQNNWHAIDQRDAFLCGVAALGCLFGQKSPELETRLALSARIALEYSTCLSSPEVEHVLGWLLRAIYLRATSSPHASWMASCTLMHMVETTKLHLEPSEGSDLAQDAKFCQPDLRRRIYWVAQLFNTWVSSDCGRSRVELRGASSELPNRVWRKDQQELCSLTYSLTRKFDFEPLEMEAEISRLCQVQPAQPMLQLLQCNIGLCFFRRARALGRTLPDDNLGLILKLAKSSLQVVRHLTEAMCPWWHILNIPFQIVCALLVIGSDHALGLLGEALDTLNQVACTYKTDMARESYETACLLVTLERQRRLKEMDHIANALKQHKLPTPSEPVFSASDEMPALGANLPFAVDEGSLNGLDINWPLADYFLLDSLLYNTAA